MFEYKVIRYEKNINSDNKIISAFVAVLVKDGDNSVIQEYWLTNDEINEISVNENKIQDIIENVVAEGLKKLEKEKTNVIRKEVVKEEELNKIKINESKVKEKLNTIKVKEQKEEEEFEKVRYKTLDFKNETI